MMVDSRDSRDRDPINKDRLSLVVVVGLLGFTRHDPPTTDSHQQMQQTQQSNTKGTRTISPVHKTSKHPSFAADRS
jgi:hypothetical protein